MSELITNEEKINIINQHIRNLEFAEYNAYLDLLQANTVSVDIEAIVEIEDRQSKIQMKIDALKLEKEQLL